MIGCRLALVLLLILPEALSASEYEDGIDAYNEHDYEEALKIFRDLSERGDPFANHYLSRMYAEGLGVEVDPSVASRYKVLAGTGYRALAKQGNTKAQYQLGAMLLGGDIRAEGEPSPDPGTLDFQSGPTDAALAEGLNWTRIAATSGHAPAARNLAFHYRNGIGVPKDTQLALKWFREAAEGGSIHAHLDLADMYLLGDGVPKSRQQYVTWLERAAEQGSTLTSLRLAQIYESGENVLQNYGQALRWYRLAAEQGGYVEQILFSQRAEKWAVKPEELIRAHAWLDIAMAEIQSINPNDKQLLPPAKGLRERLEERLSPREIRQAQELSVRLKKRF